MKKLYWAIVRCWFKNVRRMTKAQIDSYLIMRQFKNHPERWETLEKIMQPKAEERNRWFDEEMLCGPRDDRT